MGGLSGAGAITFNQHVSEEQRRYPTASGDLTALLHGLVLAAKIISREVRKAGLIDAFGLTGNINVHGEAVQILDEFANETILRNVGNTGHVCIMSSEENEEPIHVPEESVRGPYAVTFDPLDGSSNIDANISIGTIFSIHRKRSPGETGTLEDLLQVGVNQVAAGYVIYGSSTILVYSTGNGVYGFTLDPTVGEFLLSHRNVRMPETGTIYSVNEGNGSRWDATARRAIESFKGNENPLGKPYSLRYVGSLVADFHRTLLYGGLFAYPADTKNPNGKLRLLSEANPIAFIAETAGGRATTGKERIVDIVPSALHQRVPFIVGSAREVRWLESFYQ